MTNPLLHQTAVRWRDEYNPGFAREESVGSLGRRRSSSSATGIFPELPFLFVSPNGNGTIPILTQRIYTEPAPWTVLARSR